MRNPHKARILWFFAVWTAVVANFIATFSKQDAYRPLLSDSLQKDADQDERPTRLVMRTLSLTTKDASFSHQKSSQSGRKTASSGAKSQSDISKNLRGLSDTEVFSQSKSKSLPLQNSRDVSPALKRKRPDQNSSGTTVAQSSITDIQQLRKLPRTDPRRPKSRLSPKLSPEELKERNRLRRKATREAMTPEERAKQSQKKSLKRAEKFDNMTEEQYSEFLAKKRVQARAARKKLKNETPDIHEQRNRIQAEKGRKRLQEHPERKLVYNAQRKERRKELREAERSGIPAPPVRRKNRWSKESSSDPSISSLSEKSRDDVRKKSPSSPRRNPVRSHSSAALPLQNMARPSSLQQIPQRQQAWGRGGGVGNNGEHDTGEVAAQDLFHLWRAEGPD